MKLKQSFLWIDENRSKIPQVLVEKWNYGRLQNKGSKAKKNIKD
jgi:hypothetical protein